MIPQIAQHGRDIKDLDERLLRLEELMLMQDVPTLTDNRYRQLRTDLQERVSRRTLVRAAWAEIEDEPRPVKLPAIEPGGLFTVPLARYDALRGFMVEAMDLLNAYDMRGWLSDGEPNAEEPLYARYKDLVENFTEFVGKVIGASPPDLVVDSPAERQGELSVDHVHYPMRGDQVERWIKDHRDIYATGTKSWEAIDAMLDEYRLRSDYGLTIGEEMPDGDSAPE